MTDREIIAAAKEIGFECAAEMDTEKLTPLADVRAACEENKCGAYAHNWTCPPECGTLEECADRLKKYSRGIVFQTVGEVEDSFDFEGFMEAEKNHRKRIIEFAKFIRKEYPEALVLGAGGCRICAKCAYPEPCRFPNDRTSSMEAYGLFVTQVCRDNGLVYNHGTGTITYTGCALW